MKQKFSNIGIWSALIILAFSLCSCRTVYYYQVYDISSNDVPKQNDVFVFENEDVRVRYNFCKRGGDASFLCYNKTDRIIYILLDNSFYIHNGLAYDYYADVDYTATTSVTSGSKSAVQKGAMVQAGLSLTAYGKLITPFSEYPGSVTGFASGAVSRINEQAYFESTSKTEGLIKHPQKIIAIPPHYAKIIDGFSIQKSIFVECNDDKYDENFPKKSSTPITYTESNTPVSFANHISYSFNQDGQDLKSFVNRFYISQIQNKNESEVFVKRETGVSENQIYRPYDIVCRTCTKSGDSFKISSPTKFYNVYSGE